MDFANEELSSGPPDGIPEQPPEHNTGQPPDCPSIKKYTIEATILLPSGKVKKRMGVSGPCPSVAKREFKSRIEGHVLDMEIK